MPNMNPYLTLPGTIFPSSSRAWATAGYFYLHLILDFLWTDPDQRTIDQNLLPLLLDTLRADILHTEEAMKIGACSREYWLWKVVVGSYALTAVRSSASRQPDEDQRRSGQHARIASAEESLPTMKAWFEERLLCWMHVSKMTAWSDAKRELTKMAWLEQFRGEGVVEAMWTSAASKIDDQSETPGSR
jgi:hypothetical protein